MARARNLKPGFFTNEVLADCQPLARLLFAGLWCQADREGRLEHRSRKLKIEILPYDDCDIDALLNELAQRGFVHCYSIGSKNYIQIINFAKHQNPHIKEQASTIPAPDESGASTVLAGPLTSNLNLLTSNLNPMPGAGASPKRAARKRAVLDADQAKIFEEWYSVYPLHKARLGAEKAFLGALARASPAELLAGAARYRDECTGKEERYIAHPATWLNQGRWKDEHGRLNGADIHDLSERRRPQAPPSPETFGDVG